MKFNKRAQNISEYAMILAVVSIALTSISMYSQRGIQAVIKEPLDDLGAFGWTAKTKQQAQLIQEIGIEGGVDFEYGPDTPYQSQSSQSATQIVSTSVGGGRSVTLNEATTTDSSTSESFKNIKYDQIKHRIVGEPNPVSHVYQLIPAEE